MDTNGRKKMHLTGKKPRRRQSDSAAREAEAQVQYVPAKPFNRGRFLLHLATAAAVVLALVVGMSIFFKVDGEKIQISGAEKYTAWEIQEASGVRDGDGLLGLNKAKISAQISQKLPYVETVRVGIKLPDTVIIEITERTVTYAIEDTKGGWWLLNAEGRILDSTDVGAAVEHTLILNVKICDAVIGEQAVAAEPVSTDETEPVLTVTAQSRLDAAMQVFAALEKNGVMGVVNSLDVVDAGAIELEYDNRYKVSLGDTSDLEKKIAMMKAAIAEMGPYQEGYLDVSLTIYPDKVQHRPFA